MNKALAPFLPKMRIKLLFFYQIVLIEHCCYCECSRETLARFANRVIIHFTYQRWPHPFRAHFFLNAMNGHFLYPFFQPSFLQLTTFIKEILEKVFTFLLDSIASMRHISFSLFLVANTV